MKRIKRVFGSVKNLTKDEFGGSTSSILSRLTNTKSIASKSSLENKYDLNIKDGAYMGYDFQSSPLHGSHLINYSDPLNNTDQSSTKLHKYCFIGDVNKVKKLLKKININCQDSEGRTPLHLAAAAAHRDVVLLLLGERVNPEIEDYDGRTPFLIAVERNQIEIVQIFLRYKVDGLAKDKYGNQSMHLAARTGAKDVIDLLIDAGLDVNTGNVLDQTPLHIAAENINMDVVKSLLNCQVNIDAVDKESVTALMLAAKTGFNPLIDLLLQAGADLQLIDSSGWNAASYAKYSMHEELEQKLVLLTAVDITNGRPEDQTQSLDRGSKKHVRSISDTYDSWTDSSLSESQKLKLTYFNAEIESSCSSKTLPRQRLSSSSIGPPKPPRLYTSTPNLDMNEQGLEGNLNSGQNSLSPHIALKNSTDKKELTCDNTINSDITFENDDNSFLDLSRQSVISELQSSRCNEIKKRHIKSSPSRSHSLSPKSSLNESNILKEADCDNDKVEFNSKDNSSNDKSYPFSNKDQLNEIEEVWESNAHLSLSSPIHCLSADNSTGIQAFENETHVVVETHDVSSVLKIVSNIENYDIPTTEIKPASSHSFSSGVSAPHFIESKTFEEMPSDKSNIIHLLTSSTPTDREELQCLVRQLRNALHELNVSSKEKDHSLASLKKSESFLKSQLKEIEEKTSKLADQNNDFMYRLENLQCQTSALKDEATSVCHSLEEASRRFPTNVSLENKEHSEACANYSADNEELQENILWANYNTTDINESVHNQKGLGNMESIQKENNLHDSLLIAMQTGNAGDVIISYDTPAITETAVKEIRTIESAVQTDDENTIFHEAKIQPRFDACLRVMDDDHEQMFNLVQNEKCCTEENLLKMFNTVIEGWKVALEESSSKVCKSVEDYSSHEQLMFEINKRLDHLNEQVPHYGDDVKAAIQSSLCFNEDLFNRINNIEESWGTITNLKTLPDILKTQENKLESVLSIIEQMKQELGQSIHHQGTSINENNVSWQKISKKSDDKLEQHMETINDKISSVECNFDLMQSALGDKIQNICNVSDEIKEVSCGMRHISDNYGAISDAVGDHFTRENKYFEQKLKTMWDKTENYFLENGVTLEKLAQDLTSTLVNIREESSHHEKSVHSLREISTTFSDLDLKMYQILQNSLNEAPQFQIFQNMLTAHEKSIEDIKLIVQPTYDLLKSFENRSLGIDIREITDSKSEDNIKKNTNSFSNINEGMLTEVGINENLCKKDAFSQTKDENHMKCDTNEIDVLEDENRLLIAENQLLRKTFGTNHSATQPTSRALLTQNQYNEWLVDKGRLEDELKFLKKTNREIIANMSNLETDCDELEEELELKDKEMQNQKKINVIQKKEMKEMRKQLTYIACLQNEKFSLEEKAIRFEHSELEYKQIIDELQAKILQLTRENVEFSSNISQVRRNSVIKDEENIDNGLESIKTDGKDCSMESLFTNIDCHFQSIVGKKLKELNEMIKKGLPQTSPVTESITVETYQREMIKLQKEIIGMKEGIDHVDYNKELWHTRYDDLHERYQQLQRYQPYLRTPPDEEDCFEKILENVKEQLKEPYPASRYIESGHIDSDYFSSLRYSPNSGSSSFEPKHAERTFISVFRPNHSQRKDNYSPSNESEHTIPLFPTSHTENNTSPKGCGEDTSSGSNVEQSSERYINFLQIKHSI